MRRLSQQVLRRRPKAVERFWTLVEQRGTPLIEPITGQPDFSIVTFLWHGDAGTKNVVLFDGVAGFEAKDRFQLLAGTNVWYKTYRVRSDARFAYNISPNDSLVSFYDIKGDDAKSSRLAMLRVDPLNPHRCPTTFASYEAEASYAELPSAKPLLWENSTKGIVLGVVSKSEVPSSVLAGAQNVWVYTPAGPRKPHERLPLLVLFDGDRNVLWMPKLLDIAIGKHLIPPILVVMTDQSAPGVRDATLGCNPSYSDFLVKDLVPWAQKNLGATTSSNWTVVAGSSLGGLAATFVAFKNPGVFGSAITLSGSFWWKPAESGEAEWLTKQVLQSPAQPLRIYQEVGLMEPFAAQVETNRRMRDALALKHYSLVYTEYDGGHSILNWSQGMADGLHTLLSANPEPKIIRP